MKLYVAQVQMFVLLTSGALIVLLYKYIFQRSSLVDFFSIHLESKQNSIFILQVWHGSRIRREAFF